MTQTQRRAVVVVLVLLWIGNTVSRLYINDSHPDGGYVIWGIQTVISAGAATLVGGLLEHERFAYRIKRARRRVDGKS